MSMSCFIETGTEVQRELANISRVGTNENGDTWSPFAIAIFTSAFLVFQVQLLLGKEILPLFGGASAV
jgi:hypothetical protein